MKSSNPPVYFGEWVKQRRNLLDLTQAELAEGAGCSVFALRKIESGERRPSKQLAGLLAQSLEIPPEEQATFIRVARGELNLERLLSPGSAHAPLPAPTPKLLTSPNNLPVMPTPLVGREPELASLSRLLGDPNCRLLTLVGPGGIGKSRLALEAACRQWECFADGVHFASLAGTSSPEFMVPAIAQAVGLNFAGPAEPSSQLVNYLSNKQALLLLYNLEHLLAGVDVLAALLAGAPGLKLLVTSRERLELRGEWVFGVEGLPVPPEGQVEGVENYSAVQLFLLRTRQARVDFELSGADRADIVRICRLVEGMPLAIELAATWVPVLTCAEIVEEIERGLDILATRLRDVPERQRSLRAVFDHSWQLLGKDEQRAVRQLAVFHGDFSREAAETVAGAGLTLLSGLAVKSFLRRSAAGRFSVHELIRQYAAERLQETPEEALAAHSRHCHHYADLLVRLEQPFKSAQRPAALKEFMAELDNVRAAWQWAAEHQKLRELRRMSPCLLWFYETCSLFQEGEAAYRQAVDTIRSHERRDDEPQQADAIGHLIGTLGWFNFRIGRLREAFEYLVESRACAIQYDDLESHFYAYAWLDYVTWAMGDVAEARRALSEGRLLALQIGSPWHAAIPSVLLGTVAHAQGEYQEAFRQLNEALDYWRAAGDPRGLAFALASLGATTLALGKVDEAATLLRESFAVNQEIDDRWGQTYALNLHAQVLCAQKQCAEALPLLRQSLSLSKEIGDCYGEAQTWVSLGDTLCALGKDVEARHAYHAAWVMALEGRMTAVLIGAAIGTAEIYERQDQPVPALEIVLQIPPHPETSEDVKVRAAQLYAEVMSQLGPEGIEAVRTKAQYLSLETLVTSIPAPSGR